MRVILGALDPSRLSLETFDLEEYLDFLLNSIGTSFDVPLIILRHEDKIDSDKLNVVAAFGFDKEAVKKLTHVTKQNSIPRYLAKEGKCRYIPRLEGDQSYEQTEFAQTMNLRSALSCPIFVADRFAGFIIYFKTEPDGFSSEDREFLCETLNGIIQKIFTFAERLDHASNQFLELSSNYSLALDSLLISFHDAKGFLKMGSDMIERAANLTRQARFSSDEDKGKILSYLKYALNRSSEAEALVLAALKAERQIVRIEDLEELIKESRMPLQFQPHKVRVEFRGERRPISLMGNRTQLRQVFFNVIYNAYRAIAEAIETGHRREGLVEILVKQDPDFAFIDIHDNGIGIESERLSDILTGTKSTWKKGVGTGIGLRLCRKIIEGPQHLGKIKIDSEYLNGTTVHITLPKNLTTQVRKEKNNVSLTT